MPSGICGPSRIQSGTILYWMPASIMASPLPRRNGKGSRASRTCCLTDCGGLTIQNKYDPQPNCPSLTSPYLVPFQDFSLITLQAECSIAPGTIQFELQHRGAVEGWPSHAGGCTCPAAHS